MMKPTLHRGQGVLLITGFAVMVVDLAPIQDPSHSNDQKA